MSKFDKAFALFQANPSMVRKDFINMLVKEVGLSSAAASTYHYNCKKKLEEVKKTAEQVVDCSGWAAAGNNVVVVETANEVVIDIENIDDSVVPEFIKKSWAKH